MRKIAYRSGLIETVASLFALNVPFFSTEENNLIVSSAKQSYVFRTYLKNDEISLQHDNGVVTLSGTVSDESHTFLAREIVASLPGVTKVSIQLKSHDEASVMNPDAWLKTKVYFTILCHQNLHTTNLEALTKDGIVTLRGEAASVAQKNLTTEYVKNVDGVVKVKNEMIVSTVAKKAGGKKLSQKTTGTVESIDDASITALVRTTLLYNRSTTALNIEVETKDGVVKLEGKVRSWEEKNLATKLVKDIHGVKMVFNNMAIGKNVPTTN